MKANFGHLAMQCHMIVGANLAHKPAALMSGTRTLCPLATLLALHPTIAFSDVGIQFHTIQTRRSVTVFLLSFYFDVFSVVVCPLLFEPVGCRHVTSLAMATTSFLSEMPVIIIIESLSV